MHLNEFTARDTICRLALNLILSRQPALSGSDKQRLAASSFGKMLNLADRLEGLPVIDGRETGRPATLPQAVAPAVAASLAGNGLAIVLLTTDQLDAPTVRLALAVDSVRLASDAEWEQLFWMGHGDYSMFAPGYALALQVVNGSECLVAVMTGEPVAGGTTGATGDGGRAQGAAQQAPDLRRTIEDFMRRECDGTFSDDTARWTLELRAGDNERDPVGGFIDRLAAYLHGSSGGGQTPFSITVSYRGHADYRVEKRAPGLVGGETRVTSEKSVRAEVNHWLGLLKR